MVTVSGLRDAALGGLDRVVAEWAELAAALDALAGRATTGVGGPLHASHWAGADADAAARAVAGRGEQVAVAAQEARCVLTVLDTAAEQLRAAQREVRVGLAEAASAGFSLSEDGRVLRADPGRGADVATVERRLAEPVRRAAEIDDRCARALGRLYPTPAADWADTAADRMAVTALAGVRPGTIPKGDPAAAARWWAGLSATDRARYQAAYPALLGATDGLPTEVRDRANRVALAEAKAAVTAELATARAERDAAGRVDDARRRFRVTELKGRLAAIESLEAVLGSAADLFLMGFDARDDGRAIVAIGNPDRAAHTAVYVPGTGARLAHIGSDVARMRSLWQAAGRLTDPGEVSAITWVGYDAPDTLVHATTTSYADTAALALATFLRGVGVAQGIETNRHLTVIGHSYGSVVLGQAARRDEGLFAKDVIVVGSPGMHVTRAADLDLDPRHVWVGAAHDDMVVALGSGAHAPAVAGGGGRPRRITPDDAGFGANRFTTDGAEGHSEYWSTRRPTALDNQAAIVVGNYAAVRLLWGVRP
ncbi:alpha/beta hydrolase [Embleya sp. MST-111070]|uniref:alpha/beta hydrolase n=1 Tax=Embleya sp. MST-111070 TaxID=3398231 RepID=UPI003F73570F